MHWNNGRFHGPVTLEDTLFISDHKYNALSYSITDKAIKFGDTSVDLIIKGISINIEAQNNVNIESINGYLNLSGNSGIIINNSNYGTTLPTTGVEGQIFFKIIS